MSLVASCRPAVACLQGSCLHKIRALMIFHMQVEDEEEAVDPAGATPTSAPTRTATTAGAVAGAALIGGLALALAGELLEISLVHPLHLPPPCTRYGPAAGTGRGGFRLRPGTRGTEHSTRRQPGDGTDATQHGLLCLVKARGGLQC